MVSLFNDSECGLSRLPFIRINASRFTVVVASSSLELIKESAEANTSQSPLDQLQLIKEYFVDKMISLFC